MQTENHVIERASARRLIEQLFEKDILITPKQAQLLSVQDERTLLDLLKYPKEAEKYLRGIEERSEKNNTISQEHTDQLTNKATEQPAIVSEEHSKPQQYKSRNNNFLEPVTILKTYERKPKKRSYNDFVQHFTIRFNKINQMLRGRKELSGILSIDKTRRTAQPQEAVAVIGIVVEKHETKNGHIIITLEDRSATISVLFAKGREDLFETAQDITFDDVIGVTGKLGDGIIFADAIYYPDVPIQHETKKAPEEVYVACVSDIHFGNKEFMQEEFNNFIKWINGELGDQKSREIASKTKYVIVPGDLIEGVGVYPGQENDLSIQDIYEQYAYCDEVMSKINPDKHLIIIPGNHDIGRLSEPQPKISKDHLPKLYARENTYFVSNPSTIRLHRIKDFPGFNFLLYHGGSFIYYGNGVQRLFKEGGVNNPCAVMQYLLQRRHLAPAHASTLYVPDTEEDHLVIDELPDFLITGHLHMAQHKTWRGVTMVSCSCWVPITDYQAKQGLKCDPGKFALIDLRSRAIEFIVPSELINPPQNEEHTETQTQ